LSISCGLYWQSPSPNASLSNSVVLDLPEDLGSLMEAEKMAQVLEALARAWEPQWAGVIAEAAIEARDFNVRVPFVDWMVFLPHKVGGLPAASLVKELQGVGSIIIVQPTPHSEDSAEEMAVVRQVEEAIRRRVAHI
jgi:hypothetical protein